MPAGFADFLVSERLKAIQDTWQWGQFSYAQEGEDMLIQALIGKQNQGYYLDIGCHHPVRFSNTFGLYLKGWRGLNLDAMPGTAALFAPYRPEDQTLEIGVGLEAGCLQFYEFEERALNTFDAVLAEERQRTGWPLKQVFEVPVKPLSEILDAHWPEGRPIDLMSIDIEGLDEQVLRSNNWDKYRPRILLTEIYAPSTEAILAHPLYHFLRDKGYVWHAKTGLNCIFVQAEAAS